MNVQDFVKCYENVLPPDFCDFFIKFYDANEHLSTRYNNDGAPNFNKLDFTGITDEQLYADLNKSVAYMFNQCALNYADDLGMKEFFPKEYSFELIRIKKYNNDGVDEFQTHVDIGDKESSPRFLNMFCYLNDVDVGGETTFPNLDLSFKPKKGSLLIFPPNWFFPHAGLKPVSNPKYIISTNLQYY